MMPTATLNKTDYDALYQQGWSAGVEWGPTKRHQRRLMQKITAALHPKSILEVGCGEGMNLIYFKRLFPEAELTGFDLSTVAIHLVQNKIRDGFFSAMDLSQPVTPEKTYDLVLSLDVLEHVPDDVAMMQNLYQFTNQHGYCLAMTLQGKMREFERDIGHVRNYQAGELENKMTSVGFSIVQKVSWGFPFFSPLYRDFLNSGTMNQKTFGAPSRLKQWVGQFIYRLFWFNSHARGDCIFLLLKK